MLSNASRNVVILNTTELDTRVDLTHLPGIRSLEASVYVCVCVCVCVTKATRALGSGRSFRKHCTNYTSNLSLVMFLWF